MAHCTECGTNVPDGVKFCSGCGKPIRGVPVQDTATKTEPVTPEPPLYTQPVNSDASPRDDIQDAQEGKTMAILSYILFFIPLLTGAHKNSPFVKYHANQGTILFIASALWSIINNILSRILRIIPLIGRATISLLGLVSFVFLGLCIIGILNAVNGQMKPLPIIGQFTIIK